MNHLQMVLGRSKNPECSKRKEYSRKAMYRLNQVEEYSSLEWYKRLELSKKELCSYFQEAGCNRLGSYKYRL